MLSVPRKHTGKGREGEKEREKQKRGKGERKKEMKRGEEKGKRKGRVKGKGRGEKEKGINVLRIHPYISSKHWRSLGGSHKELELEGTFKGH